MVEKTFLFYIHSTVIHLVVVNKQLNKNTNCLYTVKYTCDPQQSIEKVYIYLLLTNQLQTKYQLD